MKICLFCPLTNTDPDDDDTLFDPIPHNRRVNNNLHKQSRTHFNELKADDDHHYSSGANGVDDDEMEEYDEDEDNSNGPDHSLLALQQIRAHTRFKRASASTHHRLLRHANRFANHQVNKLNFSRICHELYQFA